MRRNILRTFFAALLIFSALTVSAWAETGIVIGNGVNFREGPGTNYRVIATLERGVAVTVTNRSTPGWYAVSCGGYNGFIASSYLSVSSDSAAPALPGYTAPSGGVAIYPDGYTGSAGGSVSVYPGSGVSGNGGVSLYPGTSGSVSGTVPEAGAAGSQNASGVKEGYINAMYVRFRSAPGSSSSVIGEYNKGKSVQIYGYVDGWAACMIDSQPGYVYASYVTEGKYSGYSGSYWTGSSGSSGSTLPQPGGYSGSVSVVTPAPTPYYGYGGNVSVVPTAAPAATPYYGYGSGVAVVPTPAPTAAVDASQGTLGYIVGTYVRFRSGAGTNYSILGTYNTGKAISVIRNMGNGWLYCVIDNMAGYVHGDYVLVYNQASYGSSGSTQPPTASYAPLPTLAPIATLAPIGSQTPAPVVTQPPAVPQYPAVTQPPVSGSGTPAYISGNNVRFRSGPSMTSALIGEFFYGNEVMFYGITDGWAMVVYNGTPGYVYAQYVQQGSSGTPGAGSNSTGSVTDSSTTGSVISGGGQDVANFALQFVGYKYTWGGSSPETGFDCSGFVYYVYKQFGYTMNRVAQDQVKNGVEVDPLAIKPGDVLCFYSGSSYIGHSGIYIGNGKFVHASNSTTGVIISDLAGYYSSRGYAARRIIA